MGLLSGFVGGVANATGQVADQRISRYTAEMVAAQRDLVEQAKEQRIEEMYNRRDAANRSNAVTDEAARYKLTQDRLPSEAAAAHARVMTDVPLAAERAEATRKAAQPGLINAAVDSKAVFDAGAPTRKAASEEALATARAQTAESLAADIKKLNDPQWLAGKSKEAAAGRDPNSSALVRAQLAAATLALKEKEAEAKIPPAEKAYLKTLEDQLKTAATALAKAQSENSFDPTSINGKALLDDRKRISERITAVLSPYFDKEKMPVVPPPKYGSAAEALLGGEGTDAEFDERFGKGTAKKVRDAVAVKDPTKPGAIPTSAAAQGLLKESIDKNAASVEQTRQAAAQKDTLRAEADKITIDEIRRYSPTQAAEAYRKYGSVMPSDVLNVLRRRM